MASEQSICEQHVVLSINNNKKNPASLHLAIVNAMQTNLARLSTNKHVNRIH